MNFFEKQRDLPFSSKSDAKKQKSAVSFMHEHNIICSQTQLDDTEHEQTIICRQLFAGHVVSSRPMKRKTNLHHCHKMLVHHCHKMLTALFNNSQTLKFESKLTYILHFSLLSIIIMITSNEHNSRNSSKRD